MIVVSGGLELYDLELLPADDSRKGGSLIAGAPSRLDWLRVSGCAGSKMSGRKVTLCEPLTVK